MISVPRINLLPLELRRFPCYRRQGGGSLSTPNIVRFLIKVDKMGPLWHGTHCWMWTASLNNKGYGYFKDRTKHGGGAHKWYWELLNGPTPEGKELDHLCRNKRCVNPDHLEAVTHKVNLLRGDNPSAIHSRQTHCIHGHELTSKVNKRNERVCRACARAGYRRWYYKQKVPGLNRLPLENNMKIVLEPSEEGGFTAYIPEVPGAISEGETEEEAKEMVLDAAKELALAREELKTELGNK